MPLDDAEAVIWYRLAAAQGHATAQYNLGVRYGSGEGVPQDDIEAVIWYRLAAAQGHATAQYNLGVRYGARSGRAADRRLKPSSGTAWPPRRATPQYNLGVLYGAGRGVPQDDAEAVIWYRLAAAQGHATAQYNLGVMYGTPPVQPRAQACRRTTSGRREAQYNVESCTQPPPDAGRR